MFRLLSSAYRRNPYPAYWLLRKVKPLVHLSKFDLWFVSRYDAVKRVLSDYADFSSDFGRLMQTRFPARPMRTSLIASDPPVHTTLRGLLARGFTPRAIANLEPRIVELTNTLLDQVVAQGRIDLVGDLAYPLPVIVIAELLGIPPADREQFKRWSDQVIRSADRAIFCCRSQRRTAWGNRADVTGSQGHDGALFARHHRPAACCAT